MIALHFSPQDIDELNDQRFHHPDPLVMKRCDTVYLKAKGLKTEQIQALTGRNVKTIRSHLHLYKEGGIEALKHREPYRPQSELVSHKQSIEDEFMGVVEPFPSIGQTCVLFDTFSVPNPVISAEITPSARTLIATSPVSDTSNSHNDYTAKRHKFAFFPGALCGSFVYLVVKNYHKVHEESTKDTKRKMDTNCRCAV